MYSLWQLMSNSAAVQPMESKQLLDAVWGSAPRLLCKDMCAATTAAASAAADTAAGAHSLAFLFVMRGALPVFERWSMCRP
jgi:hypothetical protein